MNAIPDFQSVAAVLGDRSRASMMSALMDGRALTAIELSRIAEIAPSTASTHLARLREAKLVVEVRSGRHRYYRIARPEVAEAVEGLMGIASIPPPKDGKRIVQQDLRIARACYDHLAGEAGVRLLAALGTSRFVRGMGHRIEVTAEGDAWCRRLGIDIDELRSGRRAFCRECLDWTERRTHLGGALGAALLDRMLSRRQARRERVGRAIALTPAGRRFVASPSDG